MLFYLYTVTWPFPPILGVADNTKKTMLMHTYSILHQNKGQTELYCTIIMFKVTDLPKQIQLMSHLSKTGTDGFLARGVTFDPLGTSTLPTSSSISEIGVGVLE